MTFDGGIAVLIVKSRVFISNCLVNGLPGWWEKVYDLQF